MCWQNILEAIRRWPPAGQICSTNDQMSFLVLLLLLLLLLLLPSFPWKERRTKRNEKKRKEVSQTENKRDGTLTPLPSHLAPPLHIFPPSPNLKLQSKLANELINQKKKNARDELFRDDELTKRRNLNSFCLTLQFITKKQRGGSERSISASEGQINTGDGDGNVLAGDDEAHHRWSKPGEPKP